MTLPAWLFALLMAVTPPCAYEDCSTGHWDASAMGNGTGSDFVSVADFVFYGK